MPSYLNVCFAQLLKKQLIKFKVEDTCRLLVCLVVRPVFYSCDDPLCLHLRLLRLNDCDGAISRVSLGRQTQLVGPVISRLPLLSLSGSLRYLTRGRPRCSLRGRRRGNRKHLRVTNQSESRRGGTKLSMFIRLRQHRCWVRYFDSVGSYAFLSSFELLKFDWQFNQFYFH